MKKNRLRLFAAFAVLSSILALGAKGCEGNTRADIIEHAPELNELAKKFEIEELDDVIILTTYDNVTFKEAVGTLKNKTAMNKPISFYGANWGEYKSETSTVEGMEPYKGVIYLVDGWWRAIEIDAVTAISGGNTDKPVLVTEYAYCNETVYEMNKFSPEYDNYFFVLSLLDEETGSGKIQGDGSIQDAIILEFDK
ncbi:MAG: hypothetical protein FWG07_00160 [Treponema sp.]|nr:hypothetical protein [Treponema sp.]